MDIALKIAFGQPWVRNVYCVGLALSFSHLPSVLDMLWGAGGADLPEVGV